MSYIKACNKCGARISMRQMSQGQWVAFDVGSDEPHQCGVTGRKSNRTYVRKKKASKFASMNQKLDDMHIIDRLGEVYDLSSIPNEWLDLTPRNLKKLFNVLLTNERQAQILYRDRNGDSTNRKIYPLGLIQNNNHGRDTSDTLKVVGYCNLRKDYRTFSLESIEEIQALNKIPKSFRDKFNSLSSSEKNIILEGTHFYGSNSRYVESENIYDAAPQQTKAQIKPKPKKVVEREAETFKEPDYWESRPKKDTQDTWHWWFWGFCIFIIFILLS